MRGFAFLALAGVLLAATSRAQSPIPGSPVQRETAHSGAPLGQFTVGPLIVTPTFKIGTLAFDTNVRYGRTKTPDFVASAGPGLDLALPFEDHWLVNVESSAQYMYFYRTHELRQWTGYASAGLYWQTTGTRAQFVLGSSLYFDRPNYEVDTRVGRTTKDFSAQVERDIGRLTLVARGLYGRTRPDDDQTYRGADLSTSLKTDDLFGTVQLRYSLTPITALVLEGGYRETHFPDASVRNFAEDAVGAGFKTSGLLKGEILAGLRRTHLLAAPVSKTRPYVRGNLTQQLGRRFQLREGYNFNSQISAFAVDGFLPTYENRTLDVDLRIELTQRLDMTLGGTRAHMVSDGEIQVVIDSGEIVTAVRDDIVYESRADLGFRLGRARVAGFASYTNRKSVYFADFGVRGLMTGFRIEYAPNLGMPSAPAPRR